MHYYQFNIGDYHSHTNYLSLLEDLAYRRLLDAYYLSESPFPDDPKQVARVIGMRDHVEEVAQVLQDFFILENGVYINKRVDKEVQLYHAKAVTARANGKKGGRPKNPKDNPEKTQSVNLANPEKTGLKANHKPITNNQEPVTLKDSESTDSCPQQEIVNLYHEKLPTLRKMKIWNETRKKALRSRWRESPKHQSLEFWGRLFDYISQSNFLMSDDSTFIDLEWIVTAGNFVKIVEGKYHE